MAENSPGTIYMVTIHTDNFPQMKAFFADKMGMNVANEQGEFVEFASDGLRLSLASYAVLGSFLDTDHLRVKRQGSGLGIGFQFDTSGEVDDQAAKLDAAGVTIVAKPAEQPWGDYTAFFSDPDGNIHELVARARFMAGR